MSLQKLEVIIHKYPVSGEFHILLRGHHPNTAFESHVEGKFVSYRDAYNTLNRMKSLFTLVGYEVVGLNHESTEEDGRSFCERMAFVVLDTDKVESKE